MELRNWKDCVRFFQMKMEEFGHVFDYLDSTFTDGQYVLIDGQIAKVHFFDEETPVQEVYKFLRDACKEAYIKACRKKI